MKWTSVLPTEVGYYWVSWFEYGGAIDVKYLRTEIVYRRYDGLFILGGSVFYSQIEAKWYGPLEIPPDDPN